MSDLSRFKYDEMSNKVEKLDRRFASRKDADSQPQSLKNRITRSEMGARLREAETSKNIEKEKARQQNQAQHQKKKKKASVEGEVDLLSESYEGLIYLPRTPETQEAYQKILDWVFQQWDAPRNVIRSAADALLQVMKRERLEESVILPKKECEDILGRKLLDEDFAVLEALSKDITDYYDETQKDDGAGIAVDLQDAEEESVSESDNEEDAEEAVKDEEEEQVPKDEVLELGKKKESSQEAPSETKLVERKRPVESSPKSAKRIKTEEGRIEVQTKPEENTVPPKFPFKTIPQRIPQQIDLESLSEPPPITTPTVSLAKGATKLEKRAYVEYHVPAPARSDMLHIELVEVTKLPEWAQPTFPDSDLLNPIQLAVFPCAFESDASMLLCAPTGAGKTNVAMLTVLRTISNFRTENGIRLDAFKMVYIAPLKALVQEQVREFSRRLAVLGLKVGELTGDSAMTRQQLRETQLIVTTPEKWDVVTRKGDDAGFGDRVALVILDEVHLLHDERGPVLEAIVARTRRRAQQAERHVRLVGLSATLPNYEDVAAFLGAEKEGTFFFGPGYRPCPLEQRFVGVTEQKAFKQAKAIDEACVEKVRANVGKHQIIVFVHSRKDTARTATLIRDALLELGELGKVLSSDSGTKEVLSLEAENIKDASLKDLIPTGFAVHHAGLSREDRLVAEDLFAEGHVQVLVSTATLAWGVNLPAHTVIIKGTQVYLPEKGTWTKLSPQDVLQMLGRAGRPRYDKSGEGIIITNSSDVGYYLAILNEQLPIESQLVAKLSDHVNAEVVEGSLGGLEEGVNWLKLTYLYRRLLSGSDVYASFNQSDPETTMMDLVHLALCLLHTQGLVDYNQSTYTVEPAPLGRVAAHFYVTPRSMNVYATELKLYFSLPDILRVFSHSGEFQYVPARPEERPEVRALLQRVPVPVRESESDPSAKISVLLQAYILRMQLSGYALLLDMVYITQSAGRLFRALHEVCVLKGWARPAKTCLEMCKLVERRIWLLHLPFRQFDTCPEDVVRKTEASRLPWGYYMAMTSPQELGTAIGTEKYSRIAFELLRLFPKLSISEVKVQPLTTSLLRVRAQITPLWEWNFQLHGAGERFLIFIEDTNGDRILYQSSFLVRKEHIGQPISLTAEIVLPEKHLNGSQILPQAYFLSVMSEKWLHCEHRSPILLNKLKLPKRFIPTIEPSQNTLVENFPLKSIVEYVKSNYYYSHFNAVQSTVIEPLFSESQESLLITAPKGSGRSLLAELAILALWLKNPSSKAVFLSPHPEILRGSFERLTKTLGNLKNPRQVRLIDAALEPSAALRAANEAHLLCALPVAYAALLRRWPQYKKLVSGLGLVVADAVHEVSKDRAYEAALSRVRFASQQLGTGARIVAIGMPIANARDISDWLGVPKSQIFNFSPEERSMHVSMRAAANDNYLGLVMLSSKHVRPHVSGQTLVYVADRSLGVETASLWASSCKEVDINEKVRNNISDSALRRLVGKGVGLLYANMSADRYIVERLFKNGTLHTVFCSRESAYFSPCGVDSVAILGTQYYDGAQHRYVDYRAEDIWEMAGCVRDGGRVDIYTSPSKKEYYRRFMAYPVPVESVLGNHMHEVLVDEISNGVITSKQGCMDWLTYSFFYRRLQLNPSYYGVEDTSAMGLSEYLSELIEESVLELEENGVVEVEEDEDEGDGEEDEEEDESISITNIGRIAAHYGLAFRTLQTFLANLLKAGIKSQLRYYLEVFLLSSEFESLGIRQNEASSLRRLYHRLPLKSNTLAKKEDYFETSVALKVFILIQCYYLRVKLSPELRSDLHIILRSALKLINSLVDLLLSEGNLSVLRLMSMAQMVCQAVWEGDENASLKQIPYFDSAAIARCKEKDITSVSDFVTIEDDEVKMSLLGDIAENEYKLEKVILFLNSYPVISDIECSLESETVSVGDQVKLKVTISRDEDIEDDLVKLEYYPYERMENWWVIVGDAKTRTLFAIRKVVLRKELQAYNMTFSLEESGQHDLGVWVVGEGYMESEMVEFKVSVT